MQERLKEGLRAGLIVSLLTLPGCAKSSITFTVESPSPTPAVKQIPTPVLIPNAERVFPGVPIYLTYYYPELLDTDLAEYSHYVYIGDKKASIGVANLTKKRLNQSALDALYEHFISFPQKFNSLPYEIRRRKIDIEITPRDNIIVRQTVIIPRSTPLPAWAPPKTPAMTIIDNEATFSYVMVDNSEVEDEIFNSPERQATLEMATEACQQLVNTKTLGKESDYVQEIVCNSLGNAAAAKLLGAPYEKYLSNLKRRTTFSIQDPNIQFPMLSVPQELYDSIAAQGAVIR